MGQRATVLHDTVRVLDAGSDRRRILQFNVTAHPTAEWTAQQVVQAFPWDSAPRYLLRDRDGIFGGDFVQQVKVLGIKEVLSAPRSPWQRAYVERVVGTIRRECLDHLMSSTRLRCVELSVCISITITTRERIWPWTKIRWSRGQSSRRNLGLWFPCRKSADSTTVTNDSPPELPASKSLQPRRTTARRWAFCGDLHSQLTEIASGALARIPLAPQETRSYSSTLNTDGVCGRHSQRFDSNLAVRPRMTRGQDGSLLLSCVTLPFTTPRRFYPGARHGLLGCPNRFSASTNYSL
jgi:hypothetical protein